MAIGNIDYVSTKPWNSVLNPWPQYSRVSLSAIDLNLGAGVMQTLNLIVFDPVGQYALYSDGQQIELELGGTTWTVKWDGDAYYALNDAARAIPGTKAQGYDWQEPGGDNADTLYIAPVTTWLNPWEYRRRRALEYV